MGNFRLLDLENNRLTGTLDLSMFDYGATFGSANLRFKSNLYISDIILKQGALGNPYLADFRNNELGYFDLTKMPGLTEEAGYIYLGTNNMTAAEVNHILVDLDSISSSNALTRNIDISGNNSAPDSTSGGYDGLSSESKPRGKRIYSNYIIN